MTSLGLHSRPVAWTDRQRGELPLGSGKWTAAAPTSRFSIVVVGIKVLTARAHSLLLIALLIIRLGALLE